MSTGNDTRTEPRTPCGYLDRYDVFYPQRVPGFEMRPVFAEPDADTARAAAKYRWLQEKAYVSGGAWAVMGPPATEGSGPDMAARFDAAMERVLNQGGRIG